jgi:acyl carrier protein
MATIELLFRIEEAFDLQIPDQDLHKLVTVADVIAYVEERVPSPVPARPRKPSAQPKPRKNPTTKKTR